MAKQRVTLDKKVLIAEIKDHIKAEEEIFQEELALVKPEDVKIEKRLFMNFKNGMKAILEVVKEQE